MCVSTAGGLRQLNEFLHQTAERTDSSGVVPQFRVVRSERPGHDFATETHQVDFRGHLRLPEDAGTGIPVLLRLDDIFVVISSGEDELGSWRADDVAIERIFSNQFAIVLDGESMVFVAQDALGFAYDGISAIEDLQERLTKKRVFRRSKKKPKQVDAAADSQPTQASQQPVPADAPAVLDQDVPAARLVEEPADEPVLAGEPQPIWTPPSAAQPPARLRVATEPDFELAVPEPVRRVDADAAVPPAADVRVSYPQPSSPPTLAEESFVPPVTTTPEADLTEAAVPAARESLEVSPPSSDTQLTTEPEAADDGPVPVDPAPVPTEEPQARPVAEAPEFEIEEVSAASTGGTWADDSTLESEPDEPEVEIEIEEYVLPTAGAADMFTAPAQSDEVDAASQNLPEKLTAAESDMAGPEATTPTVEDLAGDDAAPTVEGKHLGDDTETLTPEDPAAAAPAERTVASNGHSKTPKTEVSEDTNKRERRHSLFGRSRDKKAPPHEHQYGDPKTIGGLKRQVCEVCAHVTFSGEDVYQGW